MKCLKTGLYFRVGNKVHHCDMYGDRENQIIVLKGFARDATDGGFHVEWVKESNSLVPTTKFSEFMAEWNRGYEGWASWDWIMEDCWNRFESITHTPKA